MLVDLMTGDEITSVPRPRVVDWKLIQDRLSQAELEAIMTTLNGMIDGTEIQTAGWMPGNDWTGTVFEPIFEKAAARNYELAGKHFGLIVWMTFKERPDRWASGKFEKGGVPIPSRTYFRVD